MKDKISLKSASRIEEQFEEHDHILFKDNGFEVKKKLGKATPFVIFFMSIILVTFIHEFFAIFFLDPFTTKGTALILLITLLGCFIVFLIKKTRAALNKDKYKIINDKLYINNILAPNNGKLKEIKALTKIMRTQKNPYLKMELLALDSNDNWHSVYTTRDKDNFKKALFSACKDNESQLITNLDEFNKKFNEAENKVYKHQSIMIFLMIAFIFYHFFGK